MDLFRGKPIVIMSCTVARTLYCREGDHFMDTVFYDIWNIIVILFQSYIFHQNKCNV